MFWLGVSHAVEGDATDGLYGLLVARAHVPRAQGRRARYHRFGKIAGCVIPLSRSSTIWMHWRCSGRPYHRSAVFNRRTCTFDPLFPPNQMVKANHTPRSENNSFRSSVPRHRKPFNSISYGSGFRSPAISVTHKRGAQSHLSSKRSIEAPGSDRLSCDIDVTSFQH